MCYMREFSWDYWTKISDKELYYYYSDITNLHSRDNLIIHLEQYLAYPLKLLTPHLTQYYLYIYVFHSTVLVLRSVGGKCK